MPVRKAFDLRTPAGFDRAVAALASELRRKTRDSDTQAVRAAVAILDVDWRTTTASERRLLVSRALEAAGRRVAAVPKVVEAVVGDAAGKVVASTRAGVRAEQGLTVRADFNALDRRILDHLRSSQALYVRDEYGRRHEAFGQRARDLVAQGLEAELGRDDIVHDLATAASSILPGHTGFYWEVVAAAFIGRGRSYAQLSAYAEARVARYQVLAVLDQRTTATCRFMDRKVFSVEAGVRMFEQVEEDPLSLKDRNPWVRESHDPSGQPHLYVEQGGARIRVADVVRSGLGTADDRGEFGRALSERDLAQVGVGFPPFHGLCRSTTLAIV